MKELFKSLLEKLNIETELLSKALEIFDGISKELQSVVILIGVMFIGSKVGSKSTKSSELKSLVCGDINGVFYVKVNTAPKYYRTVRDTYSEVFTKGSYVGKWIEYDSKAKLSGLWAFSDKEVRDTFFKACEENYAEYLKNSKDGKKVEKEVDNKAEELKALLNK